MIEADRLIELIKQNATIYYADKETNFPIPIFLNEKNLVKKEESYGMDIISTEDLYETEKDAEWASKYQRIPHTEWLDLPTWEEFMREDKMVAFTAYPYNYHLFKYGNYIAIRSFYGRGSMDIFMEPLTEENYTKACDLCVKLFRGEYDDDRN